MKQESITIRIYQDFGIKEQRDPAERIQDAKSANLEGFLLFINLKDLPQRYNETVNVPNNPE